MNKRALGIIGLSLLVGYLGMTLPVSAATTPSETGTTGQALEIAPPVVTLNADPGQTVKAQINLRNISGGKLIVTGEANDFVAAGEDGTPKILVDDNEASPYSLKEWIAPLPAMTLNSREMKVLTVTINVPASAAPGGHYGVVRFTATPPELEGTGVSLSTSLGALMLVAVNGQAKESLSIEEFSVSKDGKSPAVFESTPVEFMERLKNEGNIHLQPAGQITITDMFGKKVATVNINLPPRNILPDSIRKFTQPLDKAVLGNRRLFGKYNASLKVTYGDSKKTVSGDITFWVIPYRLIGATIVALIGAFFILRFLVRRYNQRIISRARGTRR